MKSRIIIALLLTFLMMQGVASAQERTIVQGFCKDENGKAIENVSVYVRDSLLVSVTDEKGRFTYYHAKAGERLRFAHMVFDPTYYTIREKDINGKNLTINMKTKSHELSEVEIKANAPHKVFDNPVMSVIDYTLREDGIYMIVYRRRNSALLHLSYYMDTLHELSVSSRYKQIYKDMRNEIHLIGDYQTHKVGFTFSKGEHEMYLGTPMSRAKFQKIYGPVVAASDNIYITGQYFYYNKELGYYCNKYYSEDEPYQLCYIVDEEGRDDIWLQLRTGGAMDPFSKDRIYNPIYGIGNKFYVFAFTDHETLVFDSVGNELQRYPLTFHEYRKWNGKMEPDRRWKRKMLVDEARKEFYTFFVTDGIYTLKRIDLATGTATAVMDLSGYPFAQQLRIHDGVLYFIYPIGINHRKALYQVTIAP
ncbi:MAG: carboxypeptidase-like regulatory domain-containing protein [Bacteroidales bacterium]|nr:carboxypeptidase-like regulatory domain-containing protein [Bacteroidales bacterium]